MRKKFATVLTIGSLALLLGTAGLTGSASAKTAKTKVKTSHVKEHVKKKSVKAKASKAKKRTLPGKVTGINGSTVTMKKGNKSYDVDVSGVAIVDRNGKSLSLSDIKVGHKISVKGTVTGTTIKNVSKLRDVSLPAGTETSAN